MNNSYQFLQFLLLQSNIPKKNKEDMPMETKEWKINN